MSVWERLRKALRASLYGWIAGLVAGSPFQVVESVRNAGVAGQLMVSELGIALVLWSMLTFAMALYWCDFFLLPIAWLVRATWILRHRRLWVVSSPIFGVGIMAVRLHVWTAADHDGISLINFWMWAVFAAVFFAVTAVMYARFLGAIARESAA
jgi:hypothetical protein